MQFDSLQSDNLQKKMYHLESSDLFKDLLKAMISKR